VWAALLIALTFSLGRALATTEGVGPTEYAVGLALLVLLCSTTARALRRVVHRT
jgi:hypothetical protein